MSTVVYLCPHGLWSGVEQCPDCFTVVAAMSRPPSDVEVMLQRIQVLETRVKALEDAKPNSTREIYKLQEEIRGRDFTEYPSGIPDTVLIKPGDRVRVPVGADLDRGPFGMLVTAAFGETLVVYDHGKSQSVSTLRSNFNAHVSKETLK